MTPEQAYDWLAPKLSTQERQALDLIYGAVQPEAGDTTAKDAARYRWIRENGEQGIYVLRRWRQGDPMSPLALAQGAELDTVIDEYLSGKRYPMNVEKPHG